MAAKTLQVRISEQEHEYLQNEAKKLGVSLSSYVKGMILPNNEFKKCFAELKNKTERIPIGTKFDVKSVFGTDWHTFSRGTRVALGSAFYNYAKSSNCTNICPTHKDSSSVQWYEKR